MAVGMFLKLAGVAGESQDAQHKGEIDILGWSWGVAAAPAASGGSGGVAAAKPNFHQLSVQKLLDLSSAPLLAAVAKGSRIATGTLTIVKSGGAPETFLVLNMKDIAVASVNMAESQSENRPTETVAMNFGQIDFEYTEFLPSGAKGPTDSFKWNIATNQSI
jgi:type VI secretion system secreted protein Hcp